MSTHFRSQKARSRPQFKSAVNRDFRAIARQHFSATGWANRGPSAYAPAGQAEAEPGRGTWPGCNGAARI